MTPAFYIRIDKCSNDGWYRDRIGQVMHVEWSEVNRSPDQGLPGDVYWCREGGDFNPINYVLQSDATVVLPPRAMAPVTPSPSPRKSISWDPHYWERQAALARAANPHRDTLIALDADIAMERMVLDEGIESSEETIGGLRQRRAALLSEDEKMANLMGHMSWSDLYERQVRALDAQALGDKAWEVLDAKGAEGEAVLAELLRRAGWTFKDDDEPVSDSTVSHNRGSYVPPPNALPPPPPRP